MKRRLTRPLLLALLVCLALLFVVALLGVREVGRWLVSIDPLVKSDAIFVLDGKSPHRELEAVVLYREGWAPRIVLSRPRSDIPEDVRRGFDLPPEREGLIRLLRRSGVPESAIMPLDPIVDNTLQELQVDFEYARAHGFRRVIIVSSPYHSRRIRLIWRARFEREIPAVIRATRYEPVEPTRWWRSRRSIEDVVHEIASIAHFFVGSPIPTFDQGR
jgi:uncharacterized SAM-binding protein YcdF (DUF218 family)